ncbi:MAG: hypothetical protein A3D93_05975 [Acidobacteria bacterium RIFCSPHIGHO2_12_FULL_67_30]|nr:MAG: hypothetical protein A3B65_04800 [Acidobacteria bacterium RIFCSPHIGHO2_02_FULL_67_57]OFV85949.1 MAG: hypothetical protein A2620_02590 [Acidobacteria bacterium RIFCSPHIGHO2_01_FULL_67_28]OFV89463.1 MAG: hypothetical protein A3D93_05975 [Acidobacteria bacterium RIFCSPHIGHO2_12_FULL_67_30]
MSAARPARRSERGGVFFTLLVLLLVAFLLGTLYLFRAPLLRAFADCWVVDEELEKADALVVLGGDSVQGDRVRHAVGLFHQGWAPKVVLSGGPLRADLSEADLMEKDALRQGVPAASLIVFRHPATNTLHEALALRPLLAQHNFRKVIVVTSNFHTRRARRVFRVVCEKDGLPVRVSASPDLRFHPDRWWRERDDRAWLFLELVKTLHTWYELWRLPAEAPQAQAGLFTLSEAEGPAPLPAPLPRA